MKKSKKLLSFALAALMIAGATTGCSSNTGTSSATASTDASAAASSTAGAKEFFYLNFKPETADKYKEIAAAYLKEKGVTVKVETAAQNKYEETLRTDMQKDDAPALFQINGPVGYQNWKDYCADMTDSKIYSYLTDKNLAVKSDGKVYGVPYAVEGYGIIYNDAIMKKYFALSNKAVSISSAADIKNFDTLKKVAEDMTKNKAALGIQGVFASTSFKKGEDWRWQTHLLNMSLYYEFKDNTASQDVILNGLNSKEITFKYAANYQNIFDLYLNNSCTDKKLLSNKSVDDSMAEFALGKVAMVQNGNWAWGQIAKVSGNTVKEDDVKFMPIYTGVSGEESQGICVGTENYYAINSKVSADKQKAALDFVDWLFSSATGKKFATNDLGLIAPFNTFSDSEKPNDPLAKQVSAALATGKTVVWTFPAFPGQQFKNDVGSVLLGYVQGQKKWDDVVTTTKNSWKTEKANIGS